MANFKCVTMLLCVLRAIWVFLTNSVEFRSLRDMFAPPNALIIKRTLPKAMVSTYCNV